MKSDIIKEEWREIKGFENRYEISNLGRVRSLELLLNDNGGVRFKKGKILKQRIRKNGYCDITLWKNCKGKCYLIHRLVAQTFPELIEIKEQFKGISFDKLDINHKNECKWDNSFWNLEWCDKTYNQNYGKRCSNASKSMINNTKKSKPVSQYTKYGLLINEYPSIAEAKRQTGINNINGCCNNDYKSAGGYIWKYSK